MIRNAKLADALRFLRKMRLRKLWNAAKILSSYVLMRILRRPVQWGLPFTVSIEPTTACNLRCPECPSGIRAFTRPTGNLRPDFFRKTMSELGDHLWYLIFYFQGEPYINPAFLDMVQYAHEQGVYTITSTNGHFLNDENAKRTVTSGLDRLIISVDGATQEVYQQYRRGGDLEQVLEGARNVVAWRHALGKSHPYIIFQFLVVRPSEHQIDEVKQLARKIGVDEVKLKSAQVYDYENGNPLIPTIERYTRYRKLPDGRYEPKHALTPHCWKLWHSCVITWDGAVLPCCFDKDARHQLGKLQEMSLQEIWQSRAYQNFRWQLLGGRDNIDICQNCSEGCRVFF